MSLDTEQAEWAIHARIHFQGSQVIHEGSSHSQNTRRGASQRTLAGFNRDKGRPSPISVMAHPFDLQ